MLFVKNKIKKPSNFRRFISNKFSFLLTPFYFFNCSFITWNFFILNDYWKNWRREGCVTNKKSKCLIFQELSFPCQRFSRFTAVKEFSLYFLSDWLWINTSKINKSLHPFKTKTCKIKWTSHHNQSIRSVQCSVENHSESDDVRGKI